MLSVKDKLAAGRLVAVRKLPYFRSAISALVPRETPGLGTFGVTASGIMLYDPEVVTEWSVEELGAVVVHEVQHLLRRHASRLEDVDPEQGNCAKDREINDDMSGSGLKLPGQPLMPSDLGMDPGLTAEEYYRAAEQQGAGKGGGAQGAPGSPTGDAGDQKAPGVGRGQCGGCAGNPGPLEAEIEAQCKGRSPRQLEQVRRATAEAVKKAAERGAGNVPGGLLRWADEELRPPKIPWRQKLARVVRGAVAYRPGAVDLSYTRPSRRQAGIGYGPGKPVLPALRAPVPSVFVGIDCSGSIGQQQMINAMSECNGIIKAVGAHVTFVGFDAAVHAIKQCRTFQEATQTLLGGGGTSFVPVFDALKHEKVDVLVMFTDGWGTAPTESPPYRTIWAIVNVAGAKPTEWGEEIKCFDEI